MKPGQLELTLDYPHCMVLAETCARIFCPYNLGERATTRCAMEVAERGELTMSEIAEITGDDREYLDRILRSAIRKLGPNLEVITGQTYDPRKRPCAHCHKPFKGTGRMCSATCRLTAKRQSIARWATKKRAATARRSS
jgi:hypothetical protein